MNLVYAEFFFMKKHKQRSLYLNQQYIKLIDNDILFQRRVKDFFYIRSRFLFFSYLGEGGPGGETILNIITKRDSSFDVFSHHEIFR